jgi:hypothetical protein
LVQKSSNAEAFVDHAVKQKFATLGTALKEILGDSACLDEATRNTLANAVEECRRGHVSCYLSSLARRSETSIIHGWNSMRFNVCEGAEEKN